MDKLKEAEDLYLRGFCGTYIKNKTDISIQSLLKKLSYDGVRYTKSDIVEYQIKYISDHYTKDMIIQGYIQMSKDYSNLEQAAHGKHIECLGCGFGQHGIVFRRLLGDLEYNKLKNLCWANKQKETMRRVYGVDNIFERRDLLFSNDSMCLDEIKEKRKQTMINKYGYEHPNQNPEIKQRMLKRMRETVVSRYGVTNAMQNKDIAKKSAFNRQLSMMEKYGAPNSVQVKVIRDKIFESRKKNGTLNSSIGEDVLYEMLLAYFGKDDVFRNKCVDKRYPYHVDFYIKSRDLFIELNGDKCHNSHWFDRNDEKDMQILNSWIENRDRIESSSGKKSRYSKYIETWTIIDVEKRYKASANHLNYLVFWDGSRKIRKNKKQYPRLKDANEWFDAGCPDSFDWKPENTY